MELVAFLLQQSKTIPSAKLFLTNLKVGQLANIVLPLFNIKVCAEFAQTNIKFSNQLKIKDL